MRVNINLASRKFEDVRRFFLVWGVSLAILTVLTALLALGAYLKKTHATEAATQARDLQQKIAVLQKKRNELRAFDNLPENREVAQERQYWNTQILRHSFSWTLLFNELQRIMPERAYLNSVQPDLTADNRLRLTVTITGEKQEDARQLMERMENSKRFHSTRPKSEALQKPHKGEAPTYKFEIETYYTPAGSPEKSGGKEGA